MYIMKHTNISQFNYCLTIGNFYILASLSQRTTQAGKPYLSGVLSDASGRIPFVMWENLPNITSEDAGKIVYIDGIVQEYRDAPQVKVDMLCLATEDDMEKIQMSDLVPYAPIDVDQVLNDMVPVLAHIHDHFYANIAFKIYMDNLKLLTVAPAAKSIHHAFVGGWVMHTWNMMCMAEDVYNRYKNIVPIDHDLLLAGTFLHDIGKLREFELTEQNLVKNYSTEGRLLGHPTLGVMMVEDAVKKCSFDAVPEKIRLLEHIIASHHGSPEYGAAVYPQSIEAEIVHQLDSLDSRLEIYREEMDKTPIGEFSCFNRALEHCVYNNGKTA